MSPKAEFRDIMRAAWRQAPSLFTFSFLANLLLLASAIYMLQVYDRVLSSGSFNTLLWLTVAAIGAIAAYGFLEQARRLVLGRISQWLDNQLSAPVVENGIDARLGNAEADAGLKDVADLRSFVGGEGILTFLDAPWTPVFLAFIWLLHPVLGAIGLAGAVLLFAGALANDFLTRRKQQETSAGMRRSQAAAVRFMDGAETIRSLGMVDAALRQWSKTQKQLVTDQQHLAERTTMIGSLSRAFRLALQVAVLGAGAYYVLQGQLTAGAMIAASIVLSRALAPIERSIGAWRSFVAARAARANLTRLFAEARQRPEAVELPRPDGRLTVENLRYVVPGSGQRLLAKISFDLQPGETCAVIGPSGSGKSTLCRLLVGLWSPTDGHVRLDGAEVAAWPPEQIGRHLGYLPQQVDLFPGTIAQNIARLQQVDSGEIIAAARLAGAHEMILRLPNGYQTDAGAHGSRISGGQRQRIGLARALFGDPSLIVLDEPNSNLDGDGERALVEALLVLKGRGKTVVIVSHQTRLLRSADHVLILRDGVIQSFDRPDQVLRASPGSPVKVSAGNAADAAAVVKAAAKLKAVE